jgi:UDP-N-acetylglucosamine--N-acetylmuramyl-(pentapeptide) pyrophosphoryl-undecaprenol N-acetylglucosamine transferase
MISGGGTGGHVYPALAVVDWLTTDSHHLPEGSADILWVGQRGGVEEGLVTSHGLPYASITAAAVRGKAPWQLAKSLSALFRGWRQAQGLMRTFKPDVLFVTGGYVCWPVTLAARQASVPVLIYLPDMVPGMAIKSLSRFAARVAVTTSRSQQFFRPEQVVVTGYPVRQQLFTGDRAGARQRLGLPHESAGGEDGPVLLVFGGSQGAHSINAAIMAGLSALLERSWVVHISGRRDFDWVSSLRDSLPESLRSRYQVHAYLDEEMADALLAADLVVCRAGASTLGELPAVGVPSVLVPYPYAGAHQWHNADYLVEAGAAVALPDEDLTEQLAPTVLELLGDSARRSAMGGAARALAHPDAAANIVRELEDLAG